MAYLVPSLLIAIGLVALIWGAENVIRAAPVLAKKIGISPLAAGALILGVGTSLPEFAVSIAAGISNEPLIAYGNAVGSNIANVGLILGVSALITSVIFIGTAIRQQFILTGLATLLFVVLMLDTRLVFGEGLILMGFLVIALVMIMRSKDPWQQEHKPIKGGHLFLLTITGFLGIFIGAPITVHGVSSLAINLGVPTQLVSLSLLALGTSLPELVVSVRAAMKKEQQLIIGNVLGSNIFNLLLVVAVACLFNPIYLTELDLYRDGGFLILSTVLLFILCFSWNRQRKLGIVSGLLLLAVYVSYLATIAISGF